MSEGTFSYISVSYVNCPKGACDIVNTEFFYMIPI